MKVRIRAVLSTKKMYLSTITITLRKMYLSTSTITFQIKKYLGIITNTL